MNIPHEKVAQALYDCYCEAVGGKAFNGDPLPKWTEFESDAAKQKQVNAWRAVARCAVDTLQPAK